MSKIKFHKITKHKPDLFPFQFLKIKKGKEKKGRFLKYSKRLEMADYSCF